MKTVVLYPHSGSGNHGCEALVRSTAKILAGKYRLILASKRPAEDRRYGINAICDIVRQQAPVPGRLKRLMTALRYRLGDRMAYERQTYREVLLHVDSDTIALSFGGDNYCYGKPTYIYNMNKLLRERGAKTILWGCSIEPDNIDDEMLDDLRGYHKIIARESLTADALRQHGLTNVVLHPDPAFALDTDSSVKLPAGFEPFNTIGINLSPMIMDYSSDSKLTFENYRNLIDYILTNTDMAVALIPHVVWADNDDRRPMQQLLDLYADNPRIFMAEDCNAEQLKGIISQLRFLITARTHASIAAYSTGVPTIVMGYSIKAKGIAKDLFGEYEHLVLPVQSLTAPDSLVEAFKHLVDQEDEMRQKLQYHRADLIAGALAMSNELN